MSLDEECGLLNGVYCHSEDLSSTVQDLIKSALEHFYLLSKRLLMISHELI